MEQRNPNGPHGEKARQFEDQARQIEATDKEAARPIFWQASLEWKKRIEE